MTTQLEEIGLAVYRERERRGLAIHVICKRAGVTHTTWSHVERGKNVTTQTLIAVLDELGLKLTVQS